MTTYADTTERSRFPDEWPRQRIKSLLAEYAREVVAHLDADDRSWALIHPMGELHAWVRDDRAPEYAIGLGPIRDVDHGRRIVADFRASRATVSRP